MKALQQLLDRLASGARLTGDDLIALLLVLTMLTSLVHLLTMLVTRWGDRNTAMKSLMASILIHGVCILGLEVFDPASSARIRQLPETPEKPELVAEVLVESLHTVAAMDSGNTPIVDRPVAPSIELQRFDMPSPEISEQETPEREVDPIESLKTSAADVTQFQPDDVTELAVASDAGTEGVKAPGAEDPAAELNTRYEPNSADVFAPEMERSKPDAGLVANEDRTSDPVAEMTAPELEFDQPRTEVSFSATTIADSGISLPPALENAETVERRRAPSMALDSTDGGVASTGTAPGPNAGATFQSRLPRAVRRTPDMSPAERDSRPSPDRPATPLPLTEGYDDVRIGTNAPAESDALISTAPMEADNVVIRRRENPPVTYQLRDVEVRRDAAVRFGGTRESEAAVEKSLKWLAMIQKPDGRWDASDYGAGQVGVDENGTDREFAGKNADTGVTALAILCFLGAGYTHEEGRYALEVDRALDWLISQQDSSGNLFGSAEMYAQMYCHAMATYALAEACGMQKETVLGPIVDPALLMAARDSIQDSALSVAAMSCGQPLLIMCGADKTPRQAECLQFSVRLRRVDDIRLRSALTKAVIFTFGQQDPRGGGWRYRQHQEGDVSMFGWQMMSLKSAEIAGVRIPDPVRARMTTFLRSVRQGQSGGLYGYRRNVVIAGRNSEPVNPTMTAEALFCQQMLGTSQQSPATQEAVSYLIRNLPRLSDTNYYYWYYGTLAMYQHGGCPWQEWNTIVRDMLVSEQVATGPLAGSWDPNDSWSRYGGRLYSTTLSTLTLEVYYRFLPLYRMNSTEPAP